MRVGEVIELVCGGGERGIGEGEGKHGGGKVVDGEPGAGLWDALVWRQGRSLEIPRIVRTRERRTSCSAGSALSVRAERTIRGIASVSFHNPSLLSPTI